MCKYIYRLIIFLTVVNNSIFFTERSFSAENHKRPLLGITVGIGNSPNIFTTAGSTALDFGVITEYYIGKNIYSARIIGISDINLEYDSEQITDYSFLFHRRLVSFFDEGGTITLGTGLGLVKGIKHGKPYEYANHKDIDFQAIGFPFEMRAFITVPYFGFGTIIFANMNKEWRTYGILICLQLQMLK
jgi:hypothetical protein